MKPSLSAISVLALIAALAGCSPAPEKVAPPDPVGQWQWSDSAHVTWRLEINADGTFQREITDPKKPKPSIVHGDWSIFQVQKPEKRSFFQRSNPEELSTGGNTADKAKFHWSASAMLTLHYLVPEGTRLIDGASWTGESVTPEQAGHSKKAAPQIVIGETRPIRTHTDKKTGDVFLDLEGKTYEKYSTSSAATARPEPAETPALATSAPAPRASPPPTPETTRPTGPLSRDATAGGSFILPPTVPTPHPLAANPIALAVATPAPNPLAPRIPSAPMPAVTPPPSTLTTPIPPTLVTPAPPTPKPTPPPQTPAPAPATPNSVNPTPSTPAPPATPILALQSQSASDQPPKSAGTPATIIAGRPGFLTVQPFAGVTLELPANWQGIDPATAKHLVSAWAEHTGEAPRLKPDTIWLFIPPGEVPDVFVSLNILPVFLNPHGVSVATPRDLDRFAKGVVDAGSHTLLEKGYQLKPGIKTERVMIGHRPAISCVIELTAPQGKNVHVEILAIPLDSVSVLATFAASETPGDPWPPVVDRARASLRLADALQVVLP